MGLNLFFVPFFRAFPKFLGNGTKSIFFFPTSRAFPKYCPSSFCHFRIVLFFAENPRFPRLKLFFDPRLLSFLLLQLPGKEELINKCWRQVALLLKVFLCLLSLRECFSYINTLVIKKVIPLMPYNYLLAGGTKPF